VKETMLKEKLLIIVSVALAVLIVLAGIWIFGQVTTPAAAQGDDKENSTLTGTITVIGQGTTELEPDIAQLSIGVETMAETVDEAVKENGAKMEALMETLMDVGVAEKDIQTQHYSISLDRQPEPMPRAGENEVEASKPQYRVSNMVTVKVRELDSVGEVLDAVVEAGANNVWGISFGLDDPDVARAAAREIAVADARNRAEALAELGEVELGSLVSLSEVIGASSPVPVAMERVAMSAAGPISPGQVEISYQVQAVYAIEQ
jgi:uncharacterized protein YggE